MNGSTNVQISALMTFVSVAVLWLAGYFLPDLMNTAPEMLGELFTGALIVVAGLVFNHDAGIKALPGTGSDAKSPWLVGVLALILAALAMSGCAGTTAAYKAADGLSETAYVVGEHYYAMVAEANYLDDQGLLTDRQLGSLQDMAAQTRPSVIALLDAASVYDSIRSAETEAALSAALADAALAIKRMVDAIKAVGGTSQLTTCLSDHGWARSTETITACSSLIAAR